MITRRKFLKSTSVSALSLSLLSCSKIQRKNLSCTIFHPKMLLIVVQVPPTIGFVIKECNNQRIE